MHKLFLVGGERFKLKRKNQLDESLKNQFLHCILWEMKLLVPTVFVLYHLIQIKILMFKKTLDLVLEAKSGDCQS